MKFVWTWILSDHDVAIKVKKNWQFRILLFIRKWWTIFRVVWNHQQHFNPCFCHSFHSFADAILYNWRRFATNGIWGSKLYQRRKHVIDKIRWMINRDSKVKYTYLKIFFIHSSCWSSSFFDNLCNHLLRYLSLSHSRNKECKSLIIILRGCWNNLDLSFCSKIPNMFCQQFSTLLSLWFHRLLDCIPLVSPHL